jgi:hypothetical protein
MMARVNQTETQMRIVIEQSSVGVLHSLQTAHGQRLNPKYSITGEPLIFEFPARIAPGPQFFGDQVRREGPDRRFGDIGVGQSGGDFAWQ